MTRPRQTVAHLPIEHLSAHRGNIRDDLGDLTELAASIREHGILQPITVTEHPNGHYLVLAGHRRLAAALRVKLTAVPVVIRHQVTDPAEQIVLMLVENTHRRDLNPVERAEAYGYLRNQGLTQTEIARRTGTTPSTINYYLNLLDLDDASRHEVRTGRIKSTEAIAVVREVRQQQREADGRARMGRRRKKTTPWFGVSHRLAPVVRAMCTHRDQPQVGGVRFATGCGPCWEKAIRDEQLPDAGPDLTAVPDPETPGGGSRMPADRSLTRYTYDEIAVVRRLNGDRDTPITKGDRIEIVGRGRELGWSLRDIERVTGVNKPERYLLPAEESA